MQLLSGAYFVHVYQIDAVYAVCIMNIITYVWRVMPIFQEILLKMFLSLLPPPLCFSVQ